MGLICDIFGVSKTLISILAMLQVVNSMHQPVLAAPAPVVPEPHSLTTVNPIPPSDPVIRKQVVQDLMAQMQGPYNFMQVMFLLPFVFIFCMSECVLNFLCFSVPGFHAGV